MGRAGFIRPFAFTALAALVAAGCGAGGGSLDEIAAAPAPADPYHARLRDGFVELAREQYDRGDLVDGGAYAALAARAADAEETPLSQPTDFFVPKEDQQASLGYFDALNQLVGDRGALLRAGEEVAEAQLSYECWLHEVEDQADPAAVARCRGDLDRWLPEARKRAKLPDNLAVVLPEEGEIGGVVMSRPGADDVLLDEPYAAAAADKGGYEGRVPVDPDEIQKAFAGALDSRPPAPQQFTIYFDSGSTDLDEAGRRVIADIAAAIKGRPQAEAVISGYADSPGAPAANRALSRARAESVLSALVAASEAQKLDARVEAFGESRLAVSTGDASRENRRVEVLVR